MSEVIKTKLGTVMVKEAYGENDTSRYGVFKGKLNANPNRKREGMSTYGGDLQETLRNPFGVQNNIWENRGNKLYGYGNEANSWINPLAFASRAVDNVGAVPNHLRRGFRDASNSFYHGNYGEGLYNVAAGVGNAGVDLGTGAGAAYAAYTLRNTPAAMLRRGVNLTKSVGQAGLQSVGNSFRDYDPNRPGFFKRVGSEYRRNSNSLLQTATNSSGRFGQAVYGYSDENLLNKLKSRGLTGDVDPVKLQKLKDRVLRAAPHKNFREYIDNARRTRLGQGKFRAVGSAMKHAPGWLKLPLGAGAFIAGMSGSADRKDRAKQESIWRGWDGNNMQPGFFSDLMASLPGLVGNGGGVGDRVKSWYNY